MRGRPSSRATLGEVAAAAGVSPSTVSRILNGTAVVSEAKRQAVEAAIDKLGFVPDPVAQALAGGRTRSVGVITQAIDSPFYGTALRGIEDELDRSDHSALFVSGHWNANEEARCIDMLRTRRVDGIIALGGRLSDTALRRTARELPVVVSGRALKAPGLHALKFDDQEGARLAVQHLIALGHERIAFVAGDPGHADAREREQGYREALEAGGLPVRPELIEAGYFHEEGGLAATERLLGARSRFTALFAANDQMAVGALLAMHRRGMRVPQDCSLVGFDDLLASRHALPPLTTVHQPAYEMGQIAAASMLQLLGGTVPQLQLPAPRLVLRESTAPPR